MSTFAELITNTTRKLRAHGGSTWDADDIGSEINAGYQEFCRVTHILRDTATVTVTANDGLYAMPTGSTISEVLRIWRAEWDEVLLRPVNTRWMDRMYGGSWRTNTGTTLSYYLTDADDQAQIRVYPMISSADYIGTLTLNVDYSYVPAKMAAGGSPLLPVKFHPALEWWAVSQLQEQSVQSKQNPLMGDRALLHWWRYIGAAKMDVANGLMNEYGAHIIPTVY